MPADDNLFTRLETYRKALVPIAIQLSQTRQNAQTGGEETVAVENTTKLKFHIHSITSNELRDAEAVLDAAVAPKVYAEEPASTGHGMVKVLTGYDFEDPEYVAKRDSLLPRRHAHVALAGCPELMESTPGETLPQKVDALLDRIPSVVIQMIAYQIENLGVSGAVGQEDVDRFFTDASGGEASPKPSASTKRPRARKTPKS